MITSRATPLLPPRRILQDSFELRFERGRVTKTVRRDGPMYAKNPTELVRVGISRLTTEAEIYALLRRLGFEHTPAYIGFIDDALILEQVPWPNLHVWLDRQRPGPELRRRVARNLLEVFAQAHQIAFVVGDVKPGNCLVSPETLEVKLIDFGEAFVGTPGDGLRAMLGKYRVCTPPYAAPEQFDRAIERLGPATDVFALGSMLFRLYAGREPPFRRDPDGFRADIARPLGRVSQADWAGLTPVQRQLIEGAWREDPAERFQTAGEMLSVLVRGGGAEGVRLRRLDVPNDVWRLRMDAANTIGRDARNDIVLEHPRVSRRHAQVVARARGGFDLFTDGLNHVYICRPQTNVYQVAGRATQLHVGDLMRIGSDGPRLAVESDER